MNSASRFIRSPDSSSRGVGFHLFFHILIGVSGCVHQCLTVTSVYRSLCISNQIGFVIILLIWYNEFIGILTAIHILQRVIILINNLVQYVNFYFSELKRATPLMGGNKFQLVRIENHIK